MWEKRGQSQPDRVALSLVVAALGDRGDHKTESDQEVYLGIN